MGADMGARSLQNMTQSTKTLTTPEGTGGQVARAL